MQSLTHHIIPVGAQTIADLFQNHIDERIVAEIADDSVWGRQPADASLNDIMKVCNYLQQDNMEHIIPLR